MPKYTLRRDDSGTEYTRECDEHFLLKRKIGKGVVRAGDRFRMKSLIDGTSHTETLLRIGVRPVDTSYAGCSAHATWPMKSDAMGINPDQRLAHMKADEDLGVKIDYDEKTGEAIFADRRQYQRYCEAHGFFDRNAGHMSPKRRDPRERENLGLPQLAETERAPTIFDDL